MLYFFKDNKLSYQVSDEKWTGSTTNQPSGADVWTKCPGWATVFFKSPTSPSAEKGIKVHNEAADVLKTLIEGRVVYKVDDLVDSYVRYFTRLRNISSNFIVGVEHPLTLNEKTRGKIDLFFIDIDNKKIYIIDLKTGRKKVTPKKNIQLAVYALLVFKLFNSDEFKDQQKTAFGVGSPIDFKRFKIIFSIFQEEDDEWECDKDFLVAAANTIKSSLKSKEFNLDACGGCFKVFGCPEYKKGVVSFLEKAESVLSGGLASYSDEQLSKLWAEAARVKKIAEMAEKEAKMRLEADPLTPHFRYICVKSKRKWKEPEKVPEKFLKKVPVTLAEAEKIDKKALFELTFSENTYKVINSL